MQFIAPFGTPYVFGPQDTDWPGASWNDVLEFRTAVAPNAHAI